MTTGAAQPRGASRALRVRTPGARSRGAWLAAGAALAATIAVLPAARGASSFAPLAIALFIALPGVMFFSRRVEVSLAVLLLYLGLVDGLVKLKTGSQFATLGRDVMLYAIAIGMLVRKAVRGGEQMHWPAMTRWVLAWTALVLVQLLNPSNGSIGHSLASLRQHLEFVPLFFIGASVIDSRRRLRGLLLLILVVAAVNGLVSLYQSTLTPAQLATWGQGYADLINGTNGAPRLAVGADGKPRVRPPGLGGDMGFAGILGAIAVPCGLALVLSGRGHRLTMAGVGLLVVLSALGPICSQSRSAIIATITATLAFGLMVAASKRAKQLLIGALVLGVLGFAAVSIVSSKSGSDPFFRYRSITPTKVVGTTVDSRSGTFSVFGDYLKEFPVGAGIGSTGPATGFLGGTGRTLNGESQFNFLVVEVGIPGLLVFLLFQFHLMTASIRRLRRVRDIEAQMLLAGVIAPLFAFAVNWVVGINTTSTPNAPYLWLATGILSLWLLTGPRPRAESMPAR